MQSRMALPPRPRTHPHHTPPHFHSSSSSSSSTLLVFLRLFSVENSRLLPNQSPPSPHRPHPRGRSCSGHARYVAFRDACAL